MFSALVGKQLITLKYFQSSPVGPTLGVGWFTALGLMERTPLPKKIAYIKVQNFCTLFFFFFPSHIAEKSYRVQQALPRNAAVSKM